jgi:hypothetical protein
MVKVCLTALLNNDQGQILRIMNGKDYITH